MVAIPSYAGAGRSGRGRIVAQLAGGRSVLGSVRAESPLRFLQPTPSAIGGAASVCLVTFGGGLVAGDQIGVELEVHPGARLLAFTQSSTKVFRGASRQTVTASVDGTLVLLPDPVAAFADAAFRQTTDIHLGPGGAVVALDGFTAGRAAFGERWAMRSLDLRTTIRNDAGVIVSDATRLDQADGSIADRLGSYDAVLTLIAVGQGAAAIVRSILRDPFAPPTPDLFIAASPLPRARALSGADGAILRVAASQPAVALAALRRRLRNLPDIDIVDPFGSRR